MNMASVNKIKELVAKKDFKTALNELKSIDIEKSLNPQFMKLCGQVYAENKKYDEARKTLISAHILAPKSSPIIDELIRLYLKMGFFTKAKQYYKIYMAVAPTEGIESQTVMYNVKKALQAPDEELIEILKGICDKEYVDVWAFELALLYRKAGREEDCLRECEKIMDSFAQSNLYVKWAKPLKMGSINVDKAFNCYPKQEVQETTGKIYQSVQQENEQLRKDYIELFGAPDGDAMGGSDDSIIVEEDDDDNAISVAAQITDTVKSTVSSAFGKVKDTIAHPLDEEVEVEIVEIGSDDSALDSEQGELLHDGDNAQNNDGNPWLLEEDTVAARQQEKEESSGEIDDIKAALERIARAEQRKAEEAEKRKAAENEDVDSAAAALAAQLVGDEEDDDEMVEAPDVAETKPQKVEEASEEAEAQPEEVAEAADVEEPGAADDSIELLDLGLDEDEEEDSTDESEEDDEEEFDISSLLQSIAMNEEEDSTDESEEDGEDDILIMDMDGEDGIELLDLGLDDEADESSEEDTPSDAMQEESGDESEDGIEIFDLGESEEDVGDPDLEEPEDGIEILDMEESENDGEIPEEDSNFNEDDLEKEALDMADENKPKLSLKLAGGAGGGGYSGGPNRSSFAGGGGMRGAAGGAILSKEEREFMAQYDAKQAEREAAAKARAKAAKEQEAMNAAAKEEAEQQAKIAEEQAAKQAEEDAARKAEEDAKRAEELAKAQEAARIQAEEDAKRAEERRAKEAEERAREEEQARKLATERAQKDAAAAAEEQKRKEEERRKREEAERKEQERLAAEARAKEEAALKAQKEEQAKVAQSVNNVKSKQEREYDDAIAAIRAKVEAERAAKEEKKRKAQEVLDEQERRKIKSMPDWKRKTVAPEVLERLGLVIDENGALIDPNAAKEEVKSPEPEAAPESPQATVEAAPVAEQPNEPEQSTDAMPDEETQVEVSKTEENSSEEAAVAPAEEEAQGTLEIHAGREDNETVEFSPKREDEGEGVKVADNGITLQNTGLTGDSLSEAGLTGAKLSEVDHNEITLENAAFAGESLQHDEDFAPKTEETAEEGPEVIQLGTEAPVEEAAEEEPEVIQLGTEVPVEEAAEEAPEIIQLGTEATVEETAEEAPEVIQLGAEAPVEEVAEEAPEVIQLGAEAPVEEPAKAEEAPVSEPQAEAPAEPAEEVPVEESAKAEEAPVESKPAKVIGGVEFDEQGIPIVAQKYIGKYVASSAVRKQFRKPMEKIIQKKGAYRNIVVLSRKGCSVSNVAIDFARTYHELGLCKTKIVATIKAKVLNKTDLNKIVPKLKGGCLIIEHSGDLTREKALEVYDMINNQENDIVLMLVGEVMSVTAMFGKNKELNSLFHALFLLHDLSDIDLADIAIAYMKEHGYDADQDGMRALKDHIAGLNHNGVDNVLALVDSAIAKAEKRAQNNLSDVVFLDDYEDSGMNMLKEFDFE